MDKYGIKNIRSEILNFNFDKYYKELAVQLKIIKDKDECDSYRNAERKKLSDYIDVEIDFSEIKENFINIIMDKDSAQLLWILYSKYSDGENFIDKISNVLMLENKVIRGGFNTYKMNGWMCHTLYAYQIANYNIAYDKEIINFGGRPEIKRQVHELWELHQKLTPDMVFILRVFTLIHDIGVIEDIPHHTEVGVKYVEKVVEELGITDETLSKNGIGIDLKNLCEILKVLTKNHILITALSTEKSDKCVREEYLELLSSLPNVLGIKESNPIILLLFAYGDIIAVDEKLMNEDKYERVKDGYNFFNLILQNKTWERDKRKVAIERICDIVGSIKYNDLDKRIKSIFEKNNINEEAFLDNMYNIKHFNYSSPLMKTVNDIETTIKVFNALFEVITSVESQKAISEYMIVFSPDRHETEFFEQFQNGDFYICANKMITEKLCHMEYKKVYIDLNSDLKEMIVKIIN